MNETDERSPQSPVLPLLRSAAWLTGLAALVQAVLGILIVSGVHGVFKFHSITGYVAMIAAVVAGVFSVLWQRISGNSGLMAHALTVAVLGIVQFGLGEAGLRLAHIVIGVLFLVAALALGTLSMRPNGASGRRRKA